MKRRKLAVAAACMLMMLAVCLIPCFGRTAKAADYEHEDILKIQSEIVLTTYGYELVDTIDIFDIPNDIAVSTYLLSKGIIYSAESDKYLMPSGGYPLVSDDNQITVFMNELAPFEWDVIFFGIDICARQEDGTWIGQGEGHFNAPLFFKTDKSAPYLRLDMSYPGIDFPEIHTAQDGTPIEYSAWQIEYIQFYKLADKKFDSSLKYFSDLDIFSVRRYGNTGVVFTPWGTSGTPSPERSFGQALGRYNGAIAALNGYGANPSVVFPAEINTSEAMQDYAEGYIVGYGEGYASGSPEFPALNPPPPDPPHIVRFTILGDLQEFVKLANGETSKTVEVKDGETVPFEEFIIVKDCAGLSLLGWIEFAVGFELYDFDTPVTRDLILFMDADSVPPPNHTHEVVFKNFDGTVIHTAVVPCADFVEVVSIDLEEGYYLKHWLTADGEVFDFENENITDDLVVTAVIATLTDTPAPGDDGHAHDFNGTDFIRFRCRECGISFWAALWLSVKKTLLWIIGGIAAVIVAAVVLKIILSRKPKSRYRNTTRRK